MKEIIILSLKDNICPSNSLKVGVNNLVLPNIIKKQQNPILIHRKCRLALMLAMVQQPSNQGDGLKNGHHEDNGTYVVTQNMNAQVILWEVLSTSL